MSDKPTLKEQLSSEAIRSRVVAECVTLIDMQVKAKTGLRGAALKAAYKAIKTIKRRFIPDVVDALLPDWLEKLEPFHETWQGQGSASLAEFLTARSDDVAEALLAVTDARAEKTRHKRARKYYMKHRDRAKEDVMKAVPDLSVIVERHLTPAGQKDAP